MITLGTFGAIAAISMGGKQKAKQDGPPINATSKEEEKFIQYAHIPIVMLSDLKLNWMLTGRTTETS